MHLGAHWCHPDRPSPGPGQAKLGSNGPLRWGMARSDHTDPRPPREEYIKGASKQANITHVRVCSGCFRFSWIMVDIRSAVVPHETQTLCLYQRYHSWIHVATRRIWVLVRKSRTSCRHNKAQGKDTIQVQKIRSETKAGPPSLMANHRNKAAVPPHLLHCNGLTASHSMPRPC